MRRQIVSTMYNKYDNQWSIFILGENNTIGYEGVGVELD